MFHRCTLCLLLVGVLLPLATPAQPLQPGFQVIPDCPTPHDSLEIIATYFTNCLFEGRLERHGDTLRVVAVEGCVCPASPDVLTPLTVHTAPLPPGQYDLELVRERRQNGQVCDPDTPLLLQDQVVVSTSGEIRALRTVPEEPRAGEPVTVELEIKPAPNFFLVDAVEVVGHTIQVRVSRCLLSGCPPQEVVPLELGELAPGLYTVVVVSELQGGAGPLPILEVPFAFRVEGSLSPLDRRSPKDLRRLPRAKNHPATDHFTVTPPHPRYQEAFEITVDTFLDCPQGQRSEVVGDELRLVLERDCGCPPAIPVPVTVRGTFGPLPPSLYRAVLVIQDVGQGSLGGRPCEERPQLSDLGPVLVSGSGGIFSAQLTYLDPILESGVFLDLTFSPRDRGFFPEISSDGSFLGPLLRISEDPLPILPPPQTLTEWRVPLVPLIPGDYSIVILGQGPQDLPVLEAVIPFRLPPGRLTDRSRRRSYPESAGRPYSGD